MYLDDMSNDIAATRELLSRQLTQAIATNPIDALPIITALQKQTDEHLREAVRQAAIGSSWREVALALGVSKQAAHQRFREYAKGVSAEMKTHHRTMKHARRHGDPTEAARARARRDELAVELRAAAASLKDQI
jgi:hypothetical protein